MPGDCPGTLVYPSEYRGQTFRDMSWPKLTARSSARRRTSTMPAPELALTAINRTRHRS